MILCARDDNAPGPRYEMSVKRPQVVSGEGRAWTLVPVFNRAGGPVPVWQRQA